MTKRAGTVPVIPALNTLIQPNKVPPWLRAEFVRLLAAVPLRRYGVRATLEFVFAVHPTTVPGGAAQAAAATATGGPRPSKAGEQQKRRNATITQEAMAMASRLLSTPPASVSADAWFAGIAPQLMEILDGDHGLELTKVAAYVVGFGILGRRQFGAPGRVPPETRLCVRDPRWGPLADSDSTTQAPLDGAASSTLCSRLSGLARQR